MKNSAYTVLYSTVQCTGKRKKIILVYVLSCTNNKKTFYNTDETGAASFPISVSGIIKKKKVAEAPQSSELIFDEVATKLQRSPTQAKTHN